MKDSWSSYFLLFIAGLTSLSLPFIFWMISRVSKAAHGRRLPGSEQPSPQSNPTVTPSRYLNTKLLVILNIGTSLLLLSVLVFPIAGSFQSVVAQGSRQEVFQAVLVLLLFVVLMALGLMYASKKGDLNWLK